MGAWGALALMGVVLVGTWLVLKAINNYKLRYFKSIGERMRTVENGYTAELERLRETRRQHEEVLRQYILMDLGGDED